MNKKIKHIKYNMMPFDESYTGIESNGMRANVGHCIKDIFKTHSAISDYMCARTEREVAFDQQL